MFANVIGNSSFRAALSFFVAIALALSATSASTAVAKFSSCKSLRSVYPNGIALSRTIAGAQVGKIEPPRVSSTLYLANRKLDSNKDGIACEIRVKAGVPSPQPTQVDISPSVAPAPSPSEVATSTRNYSAQILLAPKSLGDPGMLNDPDPNSLQDDGLNSSFVIQVLANGSPASNVSVSSSVDDPTAKIEALSTETDGSGKFHAWFMNGAANVQRVVFKISGDEKNLSFDLKRMSDPHVTSGRPVIVTFPDLQGAFDRLDVSATPLTAPVGTYYSFAAFSNFYTGIQSVLCNGWDLYEIVCDPARGQFRGLEGHFSVWDGTTSKGVVLHPKVVSKSTKTLCRPFDHEGSGQMCIVSFDWKPNDQVRISIKKVDGAESDYQRLQVTGINETRSLIQVFAEIDVPIKVSLGSAFAFFDENYLVASAPNCLSIEDRAIRVDKVKYYIGETVHYPKSATWYGNVVAPESTLCQNFSVAPGSYGIEIHSGGNSPFAQFKPALVGSGQDFYFQNELSSKLLVQPLDIRSILGN